MQAVILTLSADPDDSIIENAAAMGWATLQVQGATAKCWWSSDNPSPVSGLNISANTIFRLRNPALQAFRATGAGATIVVMPDPGMGSAVEI